LKLPFTKYQGTGNDFIIIDNRKRLYEQLDVAKLCHPKFGIGADGLMLLQNIEGYDFEMVYYNSDGKLSSMCGNGGRCLVDFAKHLDVFQGDKTTFKAADGPHEALWNPDIVELRMQDVERIERQGEDTYILNTGSPHYVVFRDLIDDIDIITEARAIRYNDVYRQEGINVNFVQITGPRHIKVRTYERGVENETLSCGTGVTASAIALIKYLAIHAGKHQVEIQTPGGHLSLKLQWNNAAREVWLCGPATKVFEGEIGVEG
jgi:diaminopimelate epimerase